MLTRYLNLNLSKLHTQLPPPFLFQTTETSDWHFTFFFASCHVQWGSKSCGLSLQNIFRMWPSLWPPSLLPFVSERPSAPPYSNCLLTVLPFSSHFSSKIYPQDPMYRNCYFLTVFLSSLSLASLTATEWMLRVK